MESKKHIDQFSEEFIRDYLDGKLSPAQEHRLESAMLEDPFLADAVDGLASLEDRNAVKESKGRVKKSIGLKKSPMIYFLAFAVLLTGAVFFYNLNSDNNQVVEKNLADRAETPKVETPPENSNKDEMKMVDAGKTDSSISFAFEIDESLNQTKNTERFVNVEHQDEIPPLATPLKNFDSLLAASSETKSLEVERPRANSIYHIENYKVVDYRQLRSVLLTDPNELPGGLPPSAENEEDTENDLLPRGKEEVAYTEFLEKAMIHFANGRYADALTDFETILGNYPQDANALFYGGLAAYRSGSYSSAESLLKMSLESSIATFSEESEFYLAKTLLAQGKSVESEDILHTIVAKRGFYQNQAKDLLKTL